MIDISIGWFLIGFGVGLLIGNMVWYLHGRQS